MLVEHWVEFGFSRHLASDEGMFQFLFLSHAPAFLLKLKFHLNDQALAIS